MKDSEGRADRPSSVDAEAEIEVTPEMIEAGLDELWSHDLCEAGREEFRTAALAVFRAMMSAHERERRRSGLSQPARV
jgi:hypothetical protein